MKTKIILSLALITAGTIIARAQSLPLDTALHTGKLANGFTYFIRRNNTPKNRVVFYLVNKVGSILENDDQRGLAHFLEHMSFNGTTHFPKNQLVDYLQKAGLRFGADINAYTSFDETVYKLPLPADKPDVLRNGIEIIHDWAQGATLAPEEINKERGVVLEEKRLGKGAADRMRQLYFPLMVNHSRYTDRMPIGTDEVLNNFKPEVIQRFYHDWYRPNLQAIIVVGDINVQQMEQLIRKRFSDLKNPVKEKTRTTYTIPLTGENQFIAITDPEMTATTAEVMYKQKALPLHTEADYRETIRRELFNSMINKRLSEMSHQADPSFLRGAIGIRSIITGVDAYDLKISARPGELKKGFEAIWRENERVKRFGFTATEFERSKSRYLSQVETTYNDKDKTSSASFVNEYVQYFLHGTATSGITYEHNFTVNYLKHLSLGELNAMAKNKGTNRDITLMAPEKDKSSLPSLAEMEHWMKEVESEALKPYVDGVSTKKLLAAEPVPGKIISRHRDETNGIINLLLSNGVKVLLKPTDFENDQIDFDGFAAGGTSLYSDADYQSAAASNMIASFGAGNYNSTELSKYNQLKNTGIQMEVSERWQAIHGAGKVKDFESEMQLMYAQVTAPRKDTAEFKGIMTRLKDGLVNQANNPVVVFQDTLIALLNNYSSRRTGLNAQKLSQIDLNKAFTIYKERFSNFSGFTFVIVGSIDTTTIYPILEKYMASLPSTGKIEEAKDLHINLPEGVITKTVYKGKESRASVNLVFSGPFEYSFANRIKMAALNEALQIRLSERLREDESGVYSPNTTVSCDKLPDQDFRLFITFSCSPQNVDKLIASTLDEIEQLKTNGPLQVNLDKYKAEYLSTRETDLRSNFFWQVYLDAQLQNDESLDQYKDYAKIVNSVTVDDVKQMARKYLTGKNYIKLLLMPEKGK